MLLAPNNARAASFHVGTARNGPMNMQLGRPKLLDVPHFFVFTSDMDVVKYRLLPAVDE
jgi:hypothetical protein